MGRLVGYSLKDIVQSLHVRLVYLCFVLNQMEAQRYEINLNQPSLSGLVSCGREWSSCPGVNCLELAIMSFPQWSGMV